MKMKKILSGIIALSVAVNSFYLPELSVFAKTLTTHAETEIKEPVPTIVETAEPIPTTVETVEPVPTTAETAEPVPTTIETAEPVPTTVETEEPMPVTAETAEPIPTTMETVEPVPTTVETVSPSDETAESEETLPATTETEPPADNSLISTLAAEGDFTYEVVQNSYVKITKYTGTETNIIIPDSISDYPVQAIGNGAFQNSAIVSVELPSTLITIGGSAFKACSSLNSVQFNDGLTTIGTEAFRGCSSLERAELPDSVTEIDTGAFTDCTNLTYFRYPISWKNVYNSIWINSGHRSGYIFNNCPNLISVDIPEGVTEIPAHAFTATESLLNVEFPSTLTKIGDWAFEACSSLSSVQFNDGLTTIGNGAFYSCSSLIEVRFNDGLTTIGTEAFRGCSSLERAELPDSVTEIDSGAFMDCTNLTYFKYPMSWKKVCDSVGIGFILYSGYIFNNCPNLTNIDMPEGITEIPSYAFTATQSLLNVEFPSTLTTIGSFAFESCSSLSSVQFNNGLTTIGGVAFRGCSSLERVELPDSIMEIGGGAFSYCENLTYFKYPISWKNLDNSNNNDIFSNCPNLTSIDIPEGVTEIASSAFSGTQSLLKIEFPSTLTKISDWAFKGCSSLSEVRFNNGLTMIESNAFRGCSSLERVELPDSVTEIGSGAFMDCTNLTYFKYPLSWEKVGGSVYIDSSSFPGYIFNNCSNLTSIYIPEGITEIPSFAFRATESLLNVEFPSTLTKIGDWAFDTCSSLSSVQFNDGLTTIGMGAFYSCSSLSEVRFNEELTTIDSEAFCGCSSLERAELPNSVTEIDSGAFMDCTNLTYFKYPISWKYVKYKIWTDGYVSGWIFNNCPNLTSIDIPEGVTEIPSYAFEAAKNLIKIEFPSTLTKVGTCAFRDCSSLERVELPASVTQIDSFAFENCESLTYFKYPISWKNSEKHYNSDIFSDCPNLTSIDIPEGVTEIAYMAFSGTHGLLKIEFPSTLTKIGDVAFNSCSSLSEVRFNDGLTTIGIDAFGGCFSLEKVIIPDSVTSIDSRAFTNCPFITLYCPLKQYVIPLIENGVPVVIDTAKLESEIFNTNATYYTTSTNVTSNGDKLSVTCAYEIKPEVFPTLSNTKISFYIPENAEVAKNAVYINGQLSDVVRDEYYNIMSVPISGEKGRINFTLSRTQGNTLTSYAMLNFRRSGRDQQELLGILSDCEPSVSIDAPSSTATGTIRINGYAVPDSNVSIYVDDVLAADVKTNKVGTYNTYVELSDTEDGKEYTVTARTVSGGETYTASRTVRFDSEEPEVTGFMLYYKGKVFDLLSDEQYNSIFGINQHAEKFRFEVKMKNAQNVEYLRVTSTKNGRKQYIEGEWDEKLKAFIAEGSFNSDPSIAVVPGKLSVEFIKKREQKDFSFAEFDQKYEDLIEAGRKEFNSDDLTQTELSDGSTAYSLDVSQITQFNDAGLDTLNMTYKEITESDFDNLSAKDGIRSYDLDLDGEKCTLKLDYSGTITHLFYKANEKFIDIGLENVRDEFIELVSPPNSNIPSNLSYFFLIWDVVDDACDINDDYETLVNNINNLHLDSPQKTEALKKAKELRRDRSVYLALTTMIVAIDICTGGVGGLSLALMMGAMDVMADYIFELRAANILQNNFLGSICWSIDPSGYVYEAVTTNRLPGVKASAYYIPNDDSEDFWDKDKIDPAKAVLWEASEYDQGNPTYTDNTGFYAWDVPEGWWQVKYELDDYETVYSDWLPVPPPQLDVNIGMVSKAAPKVVSVTRIAGGVVVEFDRYIKPETVTNGSIKLYDSENNELAFTAEYSSDETAADGTVYARVFTLKLSGIKTAARIKVTDAVKSYADTAAETYDKTIKSSGGFTISGKITSSGDADALTTVELRYADGETVDTTTGTTDYLFENVESGDYTLIVSKTKHCPREYAITVDGSDVEKDVEIWLYGDVNHDGKLNPSDVTQILRYCSKGKSIFDKGDDETKRYRILVASVINPGAAPTARDATQILRYTNRRSSVFDKIS